MPEFPGERGDVCRKCRGQSPLLFAGPPRTWYFPTIRAWSYPALGGEPGVHSARYAGIGATNDQKIAKLLAALRGKKGAERSAYFVCVIAVAQHGRAIAVVSGKVDGEILEAPRGTGGFGYDPVFYFPALGKTFAELPALTKKTPAATAATPSAACWK